MTLKSARFKKSLPHQGDKIYIADGGLETTFIFLKNKLGLMLDTPTWRANASCMSHA